MRFSALIVAALLAVSPASADGVAVPGVPHTIGSKSAVKYPPGAGGGIANCTGIGCGPGDLVSGASFWLGLRAYNKAAAATGTTKAISLRRASDSKTCDFDISSVTGGLGGTDVGCSGLGGGVSLATYATQDATASCTIATTTATCTGGSGLTHAGSTITGAGVTQPCFAKAAGVGTAPSFTVTLGGTGASPCGTIGSATTLTFTYGLFAPTVYDQTGQNACTSAPCNLIQVTASAQPQFLPSCFNTLPCLYFNGANSQFIHIATYPGSSQPFTISTTAFNLLSGTFQYIFTFWSSITMGFDSASATNKAYFFCGANVQPAANDATWHTMLGVCNGATSLLNIDGTATTASLGVNATSVHPTWGAGLNSTYSTSYSTDLGVWLSALTTPQQTALCHDQWANSLGNGSPPC